MLRGFRQKMQERSERKEQERQEAAEQAHLALRADRARVDRVERPLAGKRNGGGNRKSGTECSPSFGKVKSRKSDIHRDSVPFDTLQRNRENAPCSRKCHLTQKCALKERFRTGLLELALGSPKGCSFGLAAPAAVLVVGTLGLPAETGTGLFGLSRKAMSFDNDAHISKADSAKSVSARSGKCRLGRFP